ncbi:MAG TPA: hypothetical protein ENH00_01720 [Actinobacteria bacterium]|nr:hypothetical protein [Actinomycetota bacterium]HDL48941.1 hypothetical protein [Actinomycetota bacterium]
MRLVRPEVCPEPEYELLHPVWSRHVDPDPVAVDALVPELNDNPARTVVAPMSGDETAATEAWKVHVADEVPDVCIHEDGINEWPETLGG